MVKDEKSGLVFLQKGKIVHAEADATTGRDALFEIVGWKFVEFAYERSVRAPLETIDTPWDKTLLDVISREKEDYKPQRQSA